MKKLPVLIINSYAGSLTIAAHRQGHPVIGSYEDAGYGLPIQRANFPKLDYKVTTTEWPVMDLSDALVITHPPCAAFSQQNITKSARGLNAPKFQQTRTVIEYALKANVAGLAVESVCGALEGARSVHDELGMKYHYDVYRILQNACSFGVPQWRPRFWVIYLPRGRRLRMPPVPGKYVPASSICLLNGHEHDQDNTRWDRQLRLLVKATSTKWTADLAHGVHGYGSIVRPLQAKLQELGKVAPVYEPKGGNVHLSGSLCATAKAWCASERAGSTTTFLCRVARLVDPNDLLPAVLGDVWWVWAGKDVFEQCARPFFAEEYKLAMGFPADYDFSAVPVRQLRTYLSRGVCPPVAEWVLQGLQASVENRVRIPVACEPGQTLDLRPTRAEVRAALVAQKLH